MKQKISSIAKPHAAFTIVDEVGQILTQ